MGIAEELYFFQAPHFHECSGLSSKNCTKFDAVLCAGKDLSPGKFFAKSPQVLGFLYDPEREHIFHAMLINTEQDEFEKLLIEALPKF